MNSNYKIQDESCGSFHSYFNDLQKSLSLIIKLMRFRDRNRIVDDSDSKLADFDRRFRPDSKSNDEIEWTITISILN